ncbi:hypothetical protein [Mesorhizobium sp. NPDC059025]|uniref:hypothetical protein n=1 Tax=unclassified Mesorhizobium TaxID=325217 RepID=UPI00368B45D2
MADEFEIKSGDLSINFKWIDSATTTSAALDATLARLSIGLRDTFATNYKSDKGDVGDKVEIPIYSLAEWIVSNWWALLFEPRKNEGEDEDGYMSRHWLGSARAGFALPDLWLVPTGDQIEFSSRQAYLRFARLTFTEQTTCEVPRDSVRQVFGQLVSEVVKRLKTREIGETLVSELWGLISSTTPNQEFYCTLMGALGLNPYDENSQIDRILDEISDHLTPSALLDLCQASDEFTLRRSAAIASGAYDALTDARPFSLASLQPAFRRLPSDDIPAWRGGIDAAHRVRQEIGVSANDPEGGTTLFDKFGIDCSTDNHVVATEQTDFAGVSGALDPENIDEVRLSMVERKESQRRFTAARGIFLTLDQRQHPDKRLITTARTRDQQASRAFAAELLAPIRHIRARSGGSSISTYRVQEIAEELNVSPWVVKWQATNNRIHVIDSY